MKAELSRTLPRKPTASLELTNVVVMCETVFIILKIIRPIDYVDCCL